MSIRLKMILAYLAMIFFSISILVGGMVSATANFIQNVTESTVGDHSFEDVMSAVVNVMVDIKYISRYDKSLINDLDYIEGIEAQFNDFDIRLFIEQEGVITYSSAYVEEGSFETFYKDLDFERSSDEEYHTGRMDNFYGAKYSGEDHDYVILRHIIDEEITNGYMYLMMPEKDMSGIGEGVFTNVFKGILTMMFIVIVIMAILVTQWIIKPLRVLEQSTDKIRQGELDFSIKSNRNDEIGRVMNAFDTMREELQKSIEQKVQYEENRKELIASISHDLKTPITSIKGYVEGIRDGVASDPVKMDQYLEVIYHKSMDLDQMIDDLFLFSKLDLHRVPFNFVDMKARRFFEDSYEELKFDLEKSDFVLKYNNELAEDVSMRIDPQQVKRVMVNILGNAVKYSGDRKEVDMSIRLDKDLVHLEIKDYGKGISQEDLQVIFDKFYRCDPARNTDIKGSGLGLAIARQIMDSHGGAIWAESEINVGTRIHVTFERIRGGDNE